VKFKGYPKLGVGKEHSKWSPCAGMSYKEINDNTYEFDFESVCEMTEKDIFENSKKILINKLLLLQKMY
jgi:hypothetical protein